MTRPINRFGTASPRAAAHAATAHETARIPFPRAVACLALLAALALPFPAHAAEGDLVLGESAQESGFAPEELPVMDASYAALLDENGTLLFARAAVEPAQIASLTKIMTALVAVEHLDAGDTVTVTAEAAGIGESSAGLAHGDEMTFDNALKALLCASGNDAALSIARAAGADILADQGATGDAAACQAAFMDAMNDKAAEVGLENSLFTNPHGLDFDSFAQGQYSCAKDVAVLLRLAMGNDLIRASIGLSETAIAVSRGGMETTLALSNSDTMLGTYEGTCAAKTGYTLAAGPCLATAVNRGDGHEYYVVVLNSSSKPQRFIDSQALYDWAFANRDRLDAAAKAEEPAPQPAAPLEPTREETRYQLVSAPRTVNAAIAGAEAAYPVVAEVAHGDWTHAVVDATVAEPGPTVTVEAERGSIQQEATFLELHGDVHCGDAVGRLAFRQDGVVLWETDLVAAQDMAAPTWWEAIGVGFERFFGSMTGKPETAESKLVALGPLKVP